MGFVRNKENRTLWKCVDCRALNDLVPLAREECRDFPESAPTYDFTVG